MWYVVQVRTGAEENILRQCQKLMTKAVLPRCFIPYYEERKNIRGEWRTQRKVLFPGYLFVITERMSEVYEQLRKVIGYTRMIGVGEEIIPLTEEEVAFLESFGGKEQIVGMSEGVIENSKVIVHSGPLQGKEGYIRKIDRHKRRAWLEVPLFGRVQRIQVGLEILSKTV